MSVVIRLALQGRHKLPYYRIVVADKEFRRDGRYLEMVGKVNTLVEPAAVTLKQDRIQHWIGLGAIPSDTVRQLLAKQMPGFYEAIEKKRLSKLQKARKDRKARAKKSKKRELSAGKTKRKAAKKAAKAKKPKTAEAAAE